MKVRATQTGQYQGRIYHAGEEFHIDEPAKESALRRDGEKEKAWHWMEPVEDVKPVEKQKSISKKKSE